MKKLSPASHPSASAPRGDRSDADTRVGTSHTQARSDQSPGPPPSPRGEDRVAGEHRLPAIPA